MSLRDARPKREKKEKKTLIHADITIFPAEKPDIRASEVSEELYREDANIAQPRLVVTHYPPVTYAH